MLNWLITTFPDTKSRLIAGLSVMVAVLGYMQIMTMISEQTKGKIAVEQEEIHHIEDAKDVRISNLEDKVRDLEHKVDNIQNYAAKGVWSAINDNKTAIEVLKNTKRDKK